MKKIILMIMAIIFTATISCSDSDNDEIVEMEISLTQEEKEDLLFLREEEKLARDVYLYSYDLYGFNIFNNISKSEQQHMDKLLGLINFYGLEDPASSERGVFEDVDLQNLYTSLTEKSSISLEEAIIVGATIEDLDISDIDEFESRTSLGNILSVYSGLKCGSRNHMRSFASFIEQDGSIYTPQFISEAELTEILSGDKENCGQ